MTEFSVDGGGVIADGPIDLPEGTRIRVHTTNDPRDDLTVWVERGWLHVSAQYGTVHAERGPGGVTVRSITPYTGGKP